MRHWITVPGATRAPVPFALVCPCGQKVIGQRQAQHQVVRCAGCGRNLFVLPYSSLPPVAPDGPEAPLPPPARLTLPTRRSWLLPVAAAGLTLVVVVAGFVVVLSRLGTGPAHQAEDPGPALAAGRKALAEGNFHTAAENLKTACDIRDRQPAALPPEKSRDLNRLYRQAALLDDLVSESLGEIILKAAGQPKDEWEADFAHRYENKAVVFEAWVRRDPASGKYHLEYPIFAGNDQVRVEVGDLKLLRRLPPFNDPQLLLFGARLASIRREGPGSWVIRFRPDSGVFLTDPGAAAGCCTRPVDEVLRAVLERQLKWDEDTP
jgi:hypothetical protein